MRSLVHGTKHVLFCTLMHTQICKKILGFYCIFLLLEIQASTPAVNFLTTLSARQYFLQSRIKLLSNYVAGKAHSHYIKAQYIVKHCKLFLKEKTLSRKISAVVCWGMQLEKEVVVLSSTFQLKNIEFFGPIIIRCSYGISSEIREDLNHLC